MDSKDADAAIWIAVRPGMGDGGIIDWQKLKNLLTGRCHEIYHRLEIAEIAYTGTFLAAQREYWHQCSGKLAIVKGEECLIQFVSDGITGFHLRKVDGAVHGCFPDQRILLFIVSHKLEFHVASLQMGSIQFCNPFIIRVLSHLQHLLGIPCAQQVISAHNT